MSPQPSMTASPPEAPPSVRSVTAVVGILSLAIFMSSLDLFIVNLAFPSIARAYHHSSLSSLSWVLNGYSIVFAAVLVPAGRWADRLGRRRLFIAGLVVFCAGSLLCGLAPDVVTLVSARVVQAVGAGMMVPTSLSLLLAAVPPAGRAQAIGTWSALGALGAALGPVIGGSLVQLDWRLVFWINLPIGAIAVVLGLRFLPESRDEAVASRPDVVGAALLAGAVALVAYGLVEAPHWGWGSARFVATLVASVVALTAMVIRSQHHVAPVIELALLGSRTFDGAFIASILYYAGFGAFLLNSVEFLTGVWHYSPAQAGLAIGPGPLMVLPFARLVAPRLAARVGGAGRVAIAGCLVGATAMALWWARMTVHPAYLTHLLPTQLLGGVGVGLTIPSLLAAGSASLPAARFGTGSGVLNMGRQVGAVVGVAGVVAILSRVDAAHPLVPFRHSVVMVIAFFLAAAATAAGLLTSRVEAPFPVPAASIVEPTPVPASPTGAA